MERIVQEVNCGLRGYDPLLPRNSTSSLSNVQKDKNLEEVTAERPEDQTNPFTGVLCATGTDDPFPIDPDAPVEERQFTLRAIVVGCALGAIVAASNIYLGLKTGWTFGASLFGSIFGFAILKTLSTSVPTYLGGGYFGPKENNVVQSAATAAGSLGGNFVSGIPAAYQLGLLNTPRKDIGRLFTFTICCAFFGLAFSIPLRKFYILKLKLVFPSGVAAAYTIQSMHVGKRAARDAKRKTKALIFAFCFAITLRVVSEYLPGVLWDWHLFYTLNRIGWTSAIRAESWGWIWEWTPAFIGAGMLTGINPSYSFLGGTILAWAIIGPITVSTGKAFGISADKNIPGYMNYASMSLTDPIHHPSPRYWLIWPGTMMLLCTSFAEVACNWRSIYVAFRTIVSSISVRIQKERRSDIPVLEQNDKEITNSIPEEEHVPIWMWGSVLILSVIVSCVVMSVQFGQNIGVTLLAILLAFLFSFIGCESSGRTDINPLSSIGKATQLVFGGLAKGQGSVKQGELLNLLSGMLAAGAAGQAVDMISDLKTTHLLRASPKAAFLSQLCGALVSIFLSTGLYVVFSTAYPCINQLGNETCSFPAPSVQAWRAVAVAVSDPTLPIPPSSGYTAIGLGALAILSVVLKYTIVPPKYHIYVPNFSAMGIGFIINVSTYPLAMSFGSTIAYFWQARHPEQYFMYNYAVAAGFMSGEGLGGLVNALLAIVGVGGSVYGSSIGCPGGIYCG